MIEQLIAKTRWFLRDTSPLMSLLIFLSIALAVWLWLFFVRKNRRFRSIVYSVIFSASLTLIIMFTLLRKSGEIDIGFDQAFDSLTTAFIFGSESNIGFVFNILLFVPFAVVLRRKVSTAITIVTCSVLTVSIEFSQMIFRLGIFELSDIMGNYLGAITGVLIYRLAEILYHNIRDKRYQKIIEKFRGRSR